MINKRLKESRDKTGLFVWYMIDKLASPLVKPNESLVLNGFWRSGTTWLQQVLCNALNAKPVFEPFAAQVPHIQQYLGGFGSQFTDEKIVKSFMPYASPEKEWPIALERIVQQSLKSTLKRHHFTYAGRESFKDSLSQRVVVKFVKGTCLLPAIVNKFAIPTLHVRRDPRMVIASICKKPGWGGRIFDDLSLKQQFLEIPDGRYCIFDRFEEDIISADKGSIVGKIATYWAITEWFLQQSKEYTQGHIVIEKYENLVNFDEQHWLNLLVSLNLQPKKEFSEWGLNTPSFTSHKDNIATGKRKASWQYSLSRKDVYLIESITGKFGIL